MKQVYPVIFTPLNDEIRNLIQKYFVQINFNKNNLNKWCAAKYKESKGL